MNNLDIPLSMEMEVDFDDYVSKNNKEIDINVLYRLIMLKNRLCENCSKHKDCKVLKATKKIYPLTKKDGFNCYYWDSAF